MSRGFNIVELMVVVAIVAILAAVGAPQLQTFMANQRLKTIVADLYQDLALTRVQAKTAGMPVNMVSVINGSKEVTGWISTFAPNVNGTLTLTTVAERDLGSLAGYFVRACNGNALQGTDGTAFGIQFTNGGAMRYIDLTKTFDIHKPTNYGDSTVTPAVASDNVATPVAITDSAKIIISTNRSPLVKIIDFSPSGYMSSREANVPITGHARPIVDCKL